MCLKAQRWLLPWADRRFSPADRVVALACEDRVIGPARAVKRTTLHLEVLASSVRRTRVRVRARVVSLRLEARLVRTLVVQAPVASARVTGFAKIAERTTLRADLCASSATAVRLETKRLRRMRLPGLVDRTRTISEVETGFAERARLTTSRLETHASSANPVRSKE